MTEAAKPRRPWQQVLSNLSQRKVLAMLLLGFSSGLPIYLVGNTLGFWMRKEGIELSTIGFLSWVGLAYTMKFLWAPIVDKTDVPLFGRFGRRRGWMLLSQLVVVVGLVGMALVQPKGPDPVPGYRMAAHRRVRRDGRDRGVCFGHPGHRHRCLAH